MDQHQVEINLKDQYKTYLYNGSKDYRSIEGFKQDGEIRYDWADGATLPKFVMDTLAEPLHQDEVEWKWKNAAFSHSLVATGSPNGMTCRDWYSVERCG